MYYRGRSKLLITRVSKIEILKSDLTEGRVLLFQFPGKKIEIKKEEQQVRKERRSENPHSSRIRIRSTTSIAIMQIFVKTLTGKCLYDQCSFWLSKRRFYRVLCPIYTHFGANKHVNMMMLTQICVNIWLLRTTISLEQLTKWLVQNNTFEYTSLTISFSV